MVGLLVRGAHAPRELRERKFSPKFFWPKFLKPPGGHGRPRLRVMDVRTEMLVFPGFRGPDRSFCPQTSAGISRVDVRGISGPKTYSLGCFVVPKNWECVKLHAAWDVLREVGSELEVQGLWKSGAEAASQRAPKSTETQKELKWPKKWLKSDFQGPTPEWRQVTRKWLKNDSKMGPESLLSQF